MWLFLLIEKWSYFGPSFLRLAANPGPGDVQAAICLAPAVPDPPSVSNQGHLVSARSVKPRMKDAWGQGTVWMTLLATHSLPHILNFLSLVGGTPLSMATQRAVFQEKQTFSWSSATNFSYCVKSNSAFPTFLLTTKRLPFKECTFLK